MNDRLCCPKCNKSSDLWVSLPSNAFLKTRINSSAEINFCEVLEKKIGSRDTFGFYASDSDDTRMFLLDDEHDKDRLVSIYCKVCSSVFQIQKNVIRCKTNNEE